MLNKALKVKFQKNKKKVTVSVAPANYKIEQEMRVEYAKQYRAAMKMGVSTRPSMLELMRKEKIWTSEQEEELTELTIHAALLEAALVEQTEEHNIERQKELVMELTRIRAKVYELVSIKTLPLEHTCEQLAEDSQLDYYVASCTVDENGAKYFRNVDDFRQRRKESDSEAIFTAVLQELSKDNVELLRQLPEHQWLMSNDYMDKNGNLLQKELEEGLLAEAGMTADVEEMLKKDD